jgi:hypothetical protein
VKVAAIIYLAVVAATYPTVYKHLRKRMVKTRGASFVVQTILGRRKTAYIARVTVVSLAIPIVVLVAVIATYTKLIAQSILDSDTPTS